jgi:hypothetical protein
VSSLGHVWWPSCFNHFYTRLDHFTKITFYFNQQSRLFKKFRPINIQKNLSQFWMVWFSDTWTSQVFRSRLYLYCTAMWRLLLIIFILGHLGPDVRSLVCPLPSGSWSRSPCHAPGLGSERSAQLYASIPTLTFHLVSDHLLCVCCNQKSIPSGETYSPVL